MYKKLLISFSILLFSIFSFTICLANNEVEGAVDGVRNIVGGAENAVEDTAKDISNTSKNITNDIGNTMMRNGDNNNTQKDTNNGNYTATRTATTGNTFMGMNSTAWTWLIIGIAAIAIVALVWYFGTQTSNTNNH